MRWGKVALVVILGCGGDATDADGGADATTNDAAKDVASPDASKDVTVTDSSANDSSTNDASDAGPTDAGSLIDPSFDAQFQVMIPSLPTDECGGKSTTADGGLAATAFAQFENDVSQRVCNDAGPHITGRALVVGVATQEYVAKSTLTQTLGPGAYTIGNQKVADEDFCMIPNTATAFLQVLTFDDAGQATSVWNGTSGTINVTSVSAQSIAGNYSAQLGGAKNNAIDSGLIDGSFNAPLCP
jgi:hypothetical protein